MGYIAINVSVPPELLKEFDIARGLAPRSRLLQELMREYIRKVGDNGD